jgi:hypothetical protein
MQRHEGANITAYSIMVIAMAVVAAWRSAVGGIGIAILCRAIGFRRAFFVMIASAALLAAVTKL